MYYYDLEYVRELRTKCRRQNLWAPPAFWLAACETLRGCFNGVGPESWAPQLRDWVSMVLRSYNTSALIHDWEYSRPAMQKSYWRFSAANIRFVVNSSVEAAYTRCSYGRKLRIAAVGLLLAGVCQLFGWRAYRGKE